MTPRVFGNGDATASARENLSENERVSAVNHFTGTAAMHASGNSADLPRKRAWGKTLIVGGWVKGKKGKKGRKGKEKTEVNR
jgi:hypothetical protein